MPVISSFMKLLFLSLLCLFSAGMAAQVALGNGKQPREKDPVLRPDGTQLFFTRPDFFDNKGSDNAADIWMRPRYADGSWGRVLNPGSPINSFAHDRALAFSPDGNRLAVLRTGVSNFVDLLEVSGRNWRILESWPLPQATAPRFDLTFDPNALRLIYSSYGQGGQLDLFVQDALPGGKWAAATELRLLNSEDNEMSPMLASDGRTLYFRRGSQWLRQDDLNQRAVPVGISETIQQFSLLPSGTDPAAEAIVVTRQTGNKEQLLSMAFPIEARLQPSSLFRGNLPAPPSIGEATAEVPFENGRELRVHPDGLQRYAIYLREGEKLVADGSLPSMTNTQSGSLAAAAQDASSASTSRERTQLEVGIARHERDLRRLDDERRRYEQSLVQADDELLNLRAQLARAQLPAGDTLPPRGTAKSGSTRDRYAEELAELERKKAKFRQQQDDKIRQRNRGKDDYRWQETTRSTATPTPNTASRAPGIGDAYTPLPDPRLQQEQAYQDSLRLNSTVRSGLYPNQQARAYEREPWENEVQRGLPRTSPISPEEAARLDAEYQKKINEIAAMKAKLQRLNSTDSRQPAAQQSRSTINNPAWNTRGQAVNQAPARQAPAPDTYDNRYAPPASQVRAPATYGQPAAAPAAGIPAGISFIPNTAYPDGAGYGGLDQLARQIQSSATVLEIRIHTPAEMDRRAAQLLSEERATTLRNYLTEQGVSPRNYKVFGFGNNLTGSGGERVEIFR